MTFHVDNLPSSTFTGYTATLCVNTNSAAVDSEIQHRLSSRSSSLWATWIVNLGSVRSVVVVVYTGEAVCVFFYPGNVGMAASGAHKCPKSDKLDEAQALAKSCAGRPDFLPCDGLSICATHSHGKCFKLHWCCHLGWCHCEFVLHALHNSVYDHKSTSLSL